MTTDTMQTDCATCDRCTAMEMPPGTFFHCERCDETLCPYHAGSTQNDLCEDCCEAVWSRQQERDFEAHHGGSESANQRETRELTERGGRQR